MYVCLQWENLQWEEIKWLLASRHWIVASFVKCNFLFWTAKKAQWRMKHGPTRSRIHPPFRSIQHVSPRFMQCWQVRISVVSQTSLWQTGWNTTYATSRLRWSKMSFCQSAALEPMRAGLVHSGSTSPRSQTWRWSKELQKWGKRKQMEAAYTWTFRMSAPQLVEYIWVLCVDGWVDVCCFHPQKN